MQKSSHASHTIFLSGLSLSIPLIIFVFEFLFVVDRFSSEFKIVVLLLTGIGIALGVFGWWNINKIKLGFAVRVASLMGILLNAGFIYFTLVTRPPVMTGTILDIYSYAANESPFGYEHSLRLQVDLPAEESVERNLAPQEPFFIVNITSDTAIYEQTGKSQKRVLGDNPVHEGQRVRVEWDGHIWITDPAQVDATDITVLNQ